MPTTTTNTTNVAGIESKLASQPPSQSASDRRRHDRATLVTKARLLPLDPRHGPFVVVVANISEGGAGLHTVQPLPIGSRWTIEMKAGPLALEGTLEVVSCRRRPGGFVVGVRFA